MLGVSAIEGLITLIWLLRIPSDPKNAWIFGFSIERIALFVAVVLGVAILIFLFIKRLIDEKWGLKVIDNCQIFLSKPLVLYLLVFSSR